MTHLRGQQILSTISRIILSPLFHALMIALICFATMNALFPKVGHDFVYFLPRLNDSYLHYLKNGLAIQWWTPWFGGGLPSFANPQQIQFSLPQLFTQIMPPWAAINLSMAIAIFVGFYASYRFLSRGCNLSAASSQLGATLLCATGWYIDHLSIGHLGYLQWPLLYLFLWGLYDNTLRTGMRIAVAAIALALQVYGAGFYSIIIFALSLCISLPILELRRNGAMKETIRIGAPAILLAIAISAAKLAATTALMANFSRESLPIYPFSPLRIVLGLPAALFATPVAALFSDFNWIIRIMEEAQNRIGWGLWEYDIGISPLIPFVLLIYISRSHGALTSKLSRIKTIPGIALSLAIAFPASLIALLFWVSNGTLYEMLKSLPILSSLNTNTRFAAAAILPCALITAIATEKLSQRTPRLPAILSLAAVLIFSGYRAFPLSLKDAYSCDTTVSTRDWNLCRTQTKNAECLVVAPVPVDQSLYYRASAIQLYEPIFGYDLNQYTPRIVQGPTDSVFDGQFNLTDPRTLLKGYTSGRALFDRISVADSVAFYRLRAHKIPQWVLPVSQRMANTLSCGALALWFLLMAPMKLRLKNRALHPMKKATAHG